MRDLGETSGRTSAVQVAKAGSGGECFLLGELEQNP